MHRPGRKKPGVAQVLPGGWVISLWMDIQDVGNSQGVYMECSTGVGIDNVDETTMFTI